MESPRSSLRHHGLTLLLTLGIVYVFFTGMLPALEDRAEIRQRRTVVDREIEQLAPQVLDLEEWNRAARSDPLVRERLTERMRLTPDAPGYRVLPAPEPPIGVDDPPR
ncbi:MAG: hypothetical protein ACYTG2_15125 [Planctomycetota bacterium]|jgi:hypothetical protein